jgi:hypothetical protein
MKYYLLKVKGSGNLSDLLQVRDCSFTLIACFPIKKYKDALKKLRWDNSTLKIETHIKDLPYNKIKEINL